MAFVYQSRWAGGGGTVRAALMLNGGAALHLFSKSDQNKALRSSLAAGAEIWRVVFMRKRFDQSYGKKIGYDPSVRWSQQKKAYWGVDVPFIGLGGSFTKGKKGQAQTYDYEPGTMWKTVMATARVYAISAGSRLRAEVKFSYGHPLNPRAADIFTTVKPWELERVTDEAVRTLRAIIDGAEATGAAKGAQYRLPSTLPITRSPVSSMPVRKPQYGRRRPVIGYSFPGRAA